MIEARLSSLTHRAVRATVARALQSGAASEMPLANPVTSRLLETEAASWPVGEIESLRRPAALEVPTGFGEAARPYTIDEFTQFHDRSFVMAAYRGILHRRADAAGLEHHLTLLRRGRSKVEILARLRYSGEGKRVGVTIVRLRPHVAMAMALDLPVVGAVVSVLELIVRGATIRRSIRRLEAYQAQLADLHLQRVADLEARADANFRLLEERVDALRTR